MVAFLCMLRCSVWPCTVFQAGTLRAASGSQLAVVVLMSHQSATGEEFLSQVVQVCFCLCGSGFVKRLTSHMKLFYQCEHLKGTQYTYHNTHTRDEMITIDSRSNFLLTTALWSFLKCSRTVFLRWTPPFGHIYLCMAIYMSHLNSVLWCLLQETFSGTIRNLINIRHPETTCSYQSSRI